MKYDAILFDFDGVLVDSEPVHFQCWNEILADFGLSLGWEDWCANCVGVADRQMLQRMSKQFDPPIDVELLYATYPRKRARFRSLMEEKMPFFERIQPFFAALGNYSLAVVTSSGRPEVEPLLEKAGILQYIKAAVYFADVERIKPAPDPYLKAAKMLGARNPLVVEDSDAGEQSGKSAGFDVLRVKDSAEVPGALRKHLGLKI